MNISKDQAEGYFFGNPKKIAGKILFIKRDTRLEEYKEYLTDVHEFGNVWQGIKGIFQGDLFTIIIAGIGPSLIGDATYALNKPEAICLYSGTCGGLRGDIEIGDYFVADRAICGDGYSLQLGYQPFTQIPGDCKLVDSLSTTLHTGRIQTQTGTSFTTSSVTREADDDFWEKIHAECHVIEMASASFYAAAKATAKRAVAYFWVSDLPIRGKSFFDVLSSKDIEIIQDRFDRSIALDLELLSAL